MPTLEQTEPVTTTAQRVGAGIRQAITGVNTEGWGRVRLYILLAVAVLTMALAPLPWNIVGLLALFGITLDLARRVR